MSLCDRCGKGDLFSYSWGGDEYYVCHARHDVVVMCKTVCCDFERDDRRVIGYMTSGTVDGIVGASS